MTRPLGRPAVGDLLELAEEHYRFGVGPLVCRVRTVIAPVRFDGGLWWHLRGECKRGTLATISDLVGWQDRELYVDARHVRSARRPEPPG